MLFLVLFLVFILGTIFMCNAVRDGKRVYGISTIVCAIIFLGTVVIMLNLHSNYTKGLTISIESVDEVYRGANNVYYVKQDDDFKKIESNITRYVCVGNDNYIIKMTYPNMEKDYSLLLGIHKTNYIIVSTTEISEFPDIK